jgi:Domain of unknown function (DUF4351)
LTWDSPQSLDEGRYVVEFPDRRVLDFRYAVIQLNQFDWRKFLKTENAAAIALMAKMGVEPADRPRVRAACLRLLVGLELPEKKWKAISRFIDAYLPLTPAQHAEFEREIETFTRKQRRSAMEYMTSWERTGFAKGKTEGKTEGKIEGKLELVLQLLEQQVGKLSGTMQKRVSRLSAPQLDQLALSLLQFKSSSDLSKWFKEQLAQSLIGGKNGHRAK